MLPIYRAGARKCGIRLRDRPSGRLGDVTIPFFLLLFFLKIPLKNPPLPTLPLEYKSMLSYRVCLDFQANIRKVYCLSDSDASTQSTAAYKVQPEMEKRERQRQRRTDRQRWPGLGEEAANCLAAVVVNSHKSLAEALAAATEATHASIEDVGFFASDFQPRQFKVDAVAASAALLRVGDCFRRADYCVQKFIQLIRPTPPLPAVTFQYRITFVYIVDECHRAVLVVPFDDGVRNHHAVSFLLDPGRRELLPKIISGVNIDVDHENNFASIASASGELPSQGRDLSR